MAHRRRPEKKRERCLGFPGGTNCPNTPGTAWTDLWCGPCDTKRREHVSKQFAVLEQRGGGEL